MSLAADSAAAISAAASATAKSSVVVTADSLTREIMELLDNKDNAEWCHYSDLPSPMSYAKCADYDSMGNHGRFPKVEKRQTKTNKFKKLFEKLIKSEKHKPTFSK